MFDIAPNSSVENLTQFSNVTQERISLLSQLREQPSYQLGMNLVKWILPIIIVIGTLGNLTSFIIMVRREMRETSTFFYLAILALADTAVLYISGLKTLIHIYTGFELLHVNVVSCKLVHFLVFFFTQLSAWLIVAVTIERFLAVWFPLKAISICSLSRAKWATMAIAILFVLIDLHIFWTAELIESKKTINPDNIMCSAYTFKFFAALVFGWINLAISSFLPFIVLFIFNILIIIGLLRHRRFISYTMTKVDQRARYNHQRLAITLLAISFAWILTTVPRPLYMLLKSKIETLEDLASHVLNNNICYLLLYLNHAINFFLYCVTGQRFRQELVKFFVNCKKGKQKRRARMTFKTSGSGQDSSFPLMVETACTENVANSKES